MNSIQTLLISAIGVFFYVLEILIFVRILFSWLPFGVGYNSSIGRLLYQLTEPILGPVRNMVDKSPLGGGMGLDFSPIFCVNPDEIGADPSGCSHSDVLMLWTDRHY